MSQEQAGNSLRFITDLQRRFDAIPPQRRAEISAELRRQMRLLDQQHPSMYLIVQAYESEQGT
jgi:hypothetical protein